MGNTFQSKLFNPRKSVGCAKRKKRVPCGCLKVGGEGDCKNIVYISVGSECPHCGLAALAQQAPGIIACPVCGYGTNKPVT